MHESEKGHNKYWNYKYAGKKETKVLLFSILIRYIKFQNPISDRTWPYAKRDGRNERTDAQTAQKQ